MAQRSTDRPAIEAETDCNSASMHFAPGGARDSHRRRAGYYDLRIDIDILDQLSRAELRALWLQEFADKPPACLGRDVLALAIAYARQERRYGGLTKPVAKELDRLLAQALGESATDTPATTTPLPRSGTILVREWQGTTHHVTVVDDGFLWNGQTHRSLSSIARAITGTKWTPTAFLIRTSSP